MKRADSFISRRRSSLLAVLLLLISESVLSQSHPVNEQERVRGLLVRAYEVLPTSYSEAIPLFEQVLEIDPSNVFVHRQLGSVYISARRLNDALREFSVANNLAPSDTTKLQIAYLLNAVGRNQEAAAMFRNLSDSRSLDVREKARAASIVLDGLPCLSDSPWWARVSVNPYYESRFENTILNGSLRVGRYLGPGHIVSLYGVLSVTEDSRSSGGAAPVIFSDNYILVGAGLQVQPLKGITMEMQGGAAMNFTDRPGKSRGQGDFRMIASYGTGIFPELSAPDRVRFSFKPFVDLFTSAGYYSRYANNISYLQLRSGFRAVEWRVSALDVYLRGDLAADTRREFYNNIAEASIGARVIPSHLWKASLLAEYHWGTYWDSALSTGIYSRSYNSLRVSLVLDRPFCF